MFPDFGPFGSWTKPWLFGSAVKTAELPRTVDARGAGARRVLREGC